MLEMPHISPCVVGKRTTLTALADGLKRLVSRDDASPSKCAPFFQRYSALRHHVPLEHNRFISSARRLNIYCSA